MTLELLCKQLASVEVWGPAPLAKTSDKLAENSVHRQLQSSEGMLRDTH